MTRQDTSDVDTWTKCSPGTLTQLSHRIRAKQNRKVVVRVAAPVVLLICVGLGVWSMSGPRKSGDFDFGGVTCTEVQSGLQQYARGKLLPEERIAFDVHLAQCPRCQEMMRAMQSDNATPPKLDVSTRPEEIPAGGSESHRQRLAAILD